MGRPASLESRSRLVPRSRSSPTKVTAPGSAIAFKIQRLSWDPRECSATSPPLKANKSRDNLQTRQDHNILPYIIAITERKLADNLPNTEPRKRGFQRSPRGGGQTPTASRGSQGEQSKEFAQVATATAELHTTS